MSKDEFVLVFDALVMTPLHLSASICSPHVSLCPRLLCAAIRPLKHLYGIKIKVLGAEHLNLKEPYVIVCNHQASLDLMGTCRGGEGFITTWAAFGVGLSSGLWVQHRERVGMGCCGW